MPKTIRNPQQERSIDKKNRIINAGYELFSENGYYNTNTVQIAKRAGVSTGIVYGYFRDKKDILREVTSLYMEKVTKPILNLFDSLEAPFDTRDLVCKIVDLVISAHGENAGIHEALHSLTHTDPEISAQFIGLEDELTLKIADRLTRLNVLKEDAKEKVHFAMDVLQSFAHEYIYDHHEYIDYDIFKTLVTDCLVSLIDKK
ncbi:MAG TPA: TetR/AcrR family transcriptional regulator [Candidatus Ornithoclostridium faecavium]|nr:TetR/AcrR family transcriptional regulator [Candidatus Ornithoclostridium faecavium]